MGATIQNIQDRSGARLQIDQSMPEGQPRKVSISGTPASVAAAKQLVLEMTSSDIVPDPTLGGAGAGGEISEQLDIAQQMVGRVIGRGGETIKGLQVQSGAHITIDQNFPEGQPRKATVTGPTANVKRAIQMIQDLIAGGPSAVSVPGGAERVIDIQQSIVGKIIGKGGETIKGMQTQTGARIQIDQQTWKCTITGTEPAVEQAAQMITVISNGGDPPTFGPGGGAPAPGYPGYGAPGYGAPPGYGGYPGYGAPPAYGWGPPGGYGGYPGYQPPPGYGGYPGYGQQPPGYGGYPGYGQQPPASAAAAPSTTSTNSAPAPAPEGAAAASPWQCLYDSQNRPYYYNSQTQVSQWEKPADM
jgi:far upstream element-binding protein